MYQQHGGHPEKLDNIASIGFRFDPSGEDGGLCMLCKVKRSFRVAKTMQLTFYEALCDLVFDCHAVT